MKISYPAGNTTQEQLERIIAALNRINEDNLTSPIDMEAIVTKMPYTVVNRLRDKTGYVMPVGSLLDYAGSTAPDGWLLCDGSAISRATYSDLFTVIGTTFGVGDGTTTFNLPESRDNVIIGAGTTYNLADTGGAATHTLTSNEMPSHTHVQDQHKHTYALCNLGSLTKDTLDTDGNFNTWFGAAGTNYDTGFTTATNQNTGGGAAHNNLPPYIALYKIIKY